MARRAGISQARLSTLETGRVEPDLPVIRRLGDALGVPPLLLVGGEATPSGRSGALGAELRWLGLPLAAGRMPWAVRRPEEVLVAALRDPAPRVIDRLAALFLLHAEMQPALLAAHAEVLAVRQRLGWLIAVARHFCEYEHEGRSEPRTPALRDGRLDRWLEANRDSLEWDGLGSPAAPSEREGLPPFSRRWKICYDRRAAVLVANVLETLRSARGR